MSRRSKAPSNRHAVKASGILADIAIRDRRPSPHTQVREIELENVKTEEVEVNLSDIRTPMVTSLLDLSLIVGLVFGGCCA
ncbi:hypothetical protein EIP86_008042 [Pleurotus ostreatoroseus]|nr:hypothetical protein EIP86_008042 [Pleurotus ostreatoroseus]